MIRNTLLLTLAFLPITTQTMDRYKLAHPDISTLTSTQITADIDTKYQNYTAQLTECSRLYCTHISSTNLTFCHLVVGPRGSQTMIRMHGDYFAILQQKYAEQFKDPSLCQPH